MTSEERAVLEPHVIIIGAGPAGCLLAVLLAEQGARVSVYDLRSDVRKLAADECAQLRSINLALSTRALNALSHVGLVDRLTKVAVPMHSRCVHLKGKPVQLHPYGQRGQHLLSISRTTLTAQLIQACENHPAISLFFNHKCQSVDLQVPSVTILGPDGTEAVQSATLIVGADGTFSRVRAEMAKTQFFNFSQTYIHAAYKEFSLTSEATDKTFPLNALHVWPRHEYVLLALPNLPSGSTNHFTTTLMMPPEQFESLTTAEEVQEFFHTNFPDVLAAMPTLAEDYFKSPSSPLLTIRCHPYNHGANAVLIGDAAHAIVPFYGQGCNSAMEGCIVLNDAIQKHGWNNLQKALEEYTNERKPDADTIADLAIDQYHDLSSRSASKYFVLKRRVEILFNRLFPSSFLPLYSMISFSTIPYSKAVRRAMRQDRVIGLSIAAGVAIATVSFSTAVVIAASRSRRFPSLFGRP